MKDQTYCFSKNKFSGFPQFFLKNLYIFRPDTSNSKKIDKEIENNSFLKNLFPFNHVLNFHKTVAQIKIFHTIQNEMFSFS